MASLIAGDLLTGFVRVRDIPVVGGSCTTVLNGAGTITATIRLPSRDPLTGALLDLVDLITEGRSFLAYEADGRILNAGPIWNSTFDADAQQWTLNAAGIASYFDRRFVLPSGLDPRTAITAYSLLDLRTVAKRLVQQATAWSAAGLPIVFEDDVVGTEKRVYDGYALHTVGQALADLTAVGPDIQFIPQWVDDRKQGIRWTLTTGDPLMTQAGPDLYWDTTGPVPPIKGLTFTTDASQMVSTVYEVGATPDPKIDSTTTTGENGDKITPPYIAAYTDPTLPSTNFPLLEGTASDSSILDTALLMEVAQAKAAAASGPSQTWSFQANSLAAAALGTYEVGMYAQVRTEYPVPGPGTYRTRILSYTANLGDQFVTLNCAPARE